MKRKLTCTNHFNLLEKTIIKKAHQKSKCLCSGWAVGYHYPPPPPKFQLAFHIYVTRSAILGLVEVRRHQKKRDFK